MNELPSIQTSHLFPILHQKLIVLLRGLSTGDWQLETVCADWSVKDIAAHLLDTSLRTIATYRDGYSSPDTPRIQSYQDLVNYLNQLNNDWVRATRRLSPAVLIDWLAQAGREADALIMALPPNEPALFSVAWAGQAVSPNWFHVAREYTERWHHQQQIRLAVGQTADLETDELYQPLLDTFMRALPHAYRDTPAPAGTLLQFTVANLAGGNWFLLRRHNHWTLLPSGQRTWNGGSPHEPSAVVHIDRSYAWQLMTRNLAPELAALHVRIEGDQALGRQFLQMRSVMM
ncbi:maleylpyruvate isomerase N-terminal domain-containing protein [Fibrella forsythiae]|uniref:Maleylpyruvate isomerase N-terminal domain-containing protein n=1 Tax=Fibrella forsythiae TaxID=2817061 RepID=A0ABS3JDB8_9BACT|nr:maleylpyruvate isomerase N-terminal domain-containing protein [Fibrella forsythiae]MBO0947995.1 maleylpyruvate isomerase N-terminal domain-containing protein [Fibrella forsythiae]